MGQTSDELKAQLEEQRTFLGRDLVAIEDRVSPSRVMDRRTAKVRRGFHDARDRVMGSVDHATASVSSSGSSAGSAIADGAQRVAGAAGDVPDAARRQVKGSPLIAGGIAFGTGLLMAAVFAPTDAERHLTEGHEGQIRDAADSAKAAVTSVAQEAADHIKPEAQQAVADVRGTAQDAAAEVTQHASDAKDEVAAQATTAAGDIKGEATS
jgi:gas vesicle protein